MKYFVFSVAMMTNLIASAGQYDGFKVSVYTRAQEVMRMSDMNWLDSTWNIISGQLKVDKIYLETHRDLIIVPDATLVQAKKFFKDRGIEVGGGITYTINEANSFETFCYSDPEHRKKVQEIAEHTAKHFDDFILDDFFFTSCKSDIEIEAKGTKTWTQYRMDLLTEAGQTLVIGPARKVNPKVKIIIKYPNWYDHFQGLGFDLQTGPQMFDGVWTGTETRDPSSAQHLQHYLGYNIIRYFDNLRPGHNYGGWVDSGGSNMGMDRYAEQIWLTFFAKAPEIALFAYNQLIGIRLNPAVHRTPWQGQGTSFDYDQMMKPVQMNGQTVTPTTLARAAGYALETINPFISKLGKPIGIKCYKPFHSLGEDFLQNYLGMIGLPMDMYSEFPNDQQVVLLTEQAKYDPDIIAKMKKQLFKGGDIVITSGLLQAIPEKIADIAELRAGDRSALVNDFGLFGKIDKDILIKQVLYQTNDAWETVSAGRPLTGGVSGYPMLLRAPYSKGNLYVMTIPEDFGNLYDLPAGVLNSFRQTLSKDLDLRIDAPAKVSLFLYDNHTFIVESFLDEEVTININAREGINKITDMLSGSVIEKQPVLTGTSPFFRRRYDDKTNVFTITIKPHSFRLFMKNTQPPQIAVNQAGYYPDASKQAIVANMPSAKQFTVVSEKGDTVFGGELGTVRASKNSSIVTRIADFSEFTQTGKYRIETAGLVSPVFSIDRNVQNEAAKAVIKALYYQRVSMPLEERYAGIWARPAGHPDDQVIIHPSAATDQRPAGTVISSPGGWYDAGDYNKYIVNCGITMGTLLSAYEDFPEYFAKLNLNIPESGNGAPDILNEILYNLRWMFTMQDPHDGGVYNKCTNASFDGMVMPGVTKAPRYVVQKGTAATLDFAAVMAQSARICRSFSNVFPGLADSCLLAAQKAWQWAVQHPDMEYNQNEINRIYKPAISTGGYGDRRFNDEWFWAAAELYQTTSDQTYLETIRKNFPDQLTIPSWNNVYMLGIYTLLHTEMMPETAKKQLLEMADVFVKSMGENAFAVVMGQSPRDFVWGSSSVAANQGVLLIKAYQLTKDTKYLNAALSNANYLLGQNATGYSFVTGIGSKRAMHPHHRPSEADGIVDPIPGLIIGGPNPGKQDRCPSYLYHEPETCYTDDVCSYASNEIAINWNAPAVYLFNAIEALK